MALTDALNASTIMEYESVIICMYIPTQFQSIDVTNSTIISYITI